MRYQDIGNAYPILNKLNNLALPVKKAYQMFNLMGQIAPTYEFITKQELKLLEIYHGELKPNGDVFFDTEENYKNFLAQHEELNNMELEITPIELSFDDLGEERLTAEDIRKLQGFVNFTQEA